MNGSGSRLTARIIRNNSGDTQDTPVEGRRAMKPAVEVSITSWKKNVVKPGQEYGRVLLMPGTGTTATVRCSTGRPRLWSRPAGESTA